MADIITHQGIVESINGSDISVRIVQTSACASCSVKGHCSSADSKEKIIEINHTDNIFSVGDKVEITAETSMGMMAVFLAFVIPFLVLVFSLFVFMHISNSNELLSVLCSMTLLIIYYFILSRNKAKIKKNFSFKIKPIK